MSDGVQKEETPRGWRGVSDSIEEDERRIRPSPGVCGRQGGSAPTVFLVGVQNPGGVAPIRSLLIPSSISFGLLGPDFFVYSFCYCSSWSSFFSFVALRLMADSKRERPGFRAFHPSNFSIRENPTRACGANQPPTCRFFSAKHSLETSPKSA